jgi:thiol-disulfide isomerase/thioredoxin
MTSRQKIQRKLEVASSVAVLAVAALAARSTLDARPMHAASGTHTATTAYQDVGIPVGSMAPAAALQRLDGSKVDLKSYYGTRPVLIEFWASWCENCKALEPTLKAAHQKYGGQVTFLGVAVTVSQSVPRVKAYMEQHKLPLEMLWDAEGNATDAYKVPATSYVVLIDKGGKVVYGGVGGSQKLDAAIAKVVQ